MNDLKFAIRQLLKNSGLTYVAVLAPGIKTKITIAKGMLNS